MEKHHITLIITGSVAAVKCYDLIQAMQAKELHVCVVLTHSAQQWITKEALSSLVTGDIFTEDDYKTNSDKLEPALNKSDAILVAPASADFIKQLKYHDSILAEALLRSGKPVVIAPAMNVMMWQHPATQRNVKALLSQKMRFLGPADGAMACGDTGYGRFMEPTIICEAIEAMLSWNNHDAFSQIDHALVSRPTLPELDTSLVSKIQKRILLLIEGGSDAASSYNLISTLRTRGYTVDCVLSEQAQKLTPPQGLSSVTGRQTYTHHYQDDTQGMEHIRLPEDSDMILIYPATDTGVKDMIQGSAHHFVGCIYLASKKPVALVPSIDDNHSPDPANLERLIEDGVHILPVDEHYHPVSKDRAIAVADALEHAICHDIKGHRDT